jgi:glycosyltransferase involved in cell wall biosynthesis
MKIAFISDTPNPKMVGGGEYAIYKYAEALALKGHDVTVYGQFDRPYIRELTQCPNLHIKIRGGLELSIKGVGAINRIWDRIHTNYFLLPALRRRTKPDIIIGYQRRSSIKAVMLGRMLDIPVGHIAFEPPTTMIDVLGEAYNRIMKGPLGDEWTLVKEAYQSSCALIPLTKFAGDEVTRWCGMPVSDPVYAGMEMPKAAAGFPNKDEHILYVGRLDSTKNVHDLIDAVALLRNPPPLVVVGNGYDREQLEERAKKKAIDCVFKGAVSDEEKWRLIRSCHFLVFPTSLEGLGMPPGEALVAGKPAICSDIPVLREVYGDQVEYFPLHDVAALATKMEDLLARPECRRERGVAGREYVLEQYTWASCAERIETGLGEWMSSGSN